MAAVQNAYAMRIICVGTSIVFVESVLLESWDMQAAGQPTTKRVSVSLGEDVLEQLQDIARKRGASMTEAIRIAIKTQWYVQQEMEKGSKILVEKPDHTIREIVFQ